MDPMDNQCISVEQPLLQQNSVTDAQQHTNLILNLSNRQNGTNNLNNVTKSTRRTTHLYVSVFISIVMIFIFSLLEMKNAAQNTVLLYVFLHLLSLHVWLPLLV
jgi:hypothetical protein